MAQCQAKAVFNLSKIPYEVLCKIHCRNTFPCPAEFHCEIPCKSHCSNTFPCHMSFSDVQKSSFEASLTIKFEFFRIL
jgi:hypothetical protein